MNVGDHVVVFGDRSTDLDHRRFLKCIGADGFLRNLAGDRDDRHAVQFGIGNSSHQIGSSRTAGRHTDSDFSRRSGHTLSGKRAALFVARQNRANAIAILAECLMQRHAGSPGVRKAVLRPLTNEHFHENLRSRNGLGGLFND